MHVLVTGATGFIGGHLVPELLHRGHDVTVLIRDRERYDSPDGVRVIEGDLLAPESATIVATDGGDERQCSLGEALEGCEAAYYLVHSMRAGKDFEQRDRRIAESFAVAAAEAEVARVIYLGGLGEDTDDLSEHLRSRREIERILADGDYTLTTLRAAIVVGAGSAGFETVCQLAEKLPVMLTPRWVRTPCQPIAIADAVAYLTGVLDAPETAGNTYEIGGPEILTYEEMIRRVGRKLGREPVVIPVPILSPRLSSYWVELMTDVDRSVVRPLVEGLRNPVVVTDDRIDEHVDVAHTPFDEAVDRALRERDGGAPVE